MNKYELRKTNMNDVILHVKTDSDTGDQNGNQNYAFPVTRYQNVMGRPQVVSDIANVYGSPFVFYDEGEVEISDEEYELLFGNIR